MKDLEHICGWKRLTNRGKESGKTYLKKPLFICAYNCDGFNFSCGGYYRANVINLTPPKR